MRRIAALFTALFAANSLPASLAIRCPLQGMHEPRLGCTMPPQFNAAPSTEMSILAVRTGRGPIPSLNMEPPPLSQRD